MALRTTLRRLQLGLPTLLGLQRRGWFIPYRYADTLPAAGQSAPYAPIVELFASLEPAFLGLLELAESHAGALRAIAAATPGQAGPAPRFDQGWFPTLDAVIAYSLIRERRPRRMVEIGSGHSTRFLARAAFDGGFACEILAIDPQPRAAIAALPQVRLLQRTVQQVEPSQWPALGANDVLFIDSSHILMPGSDVDHLFNRILPRLPAGVLLHIHDIFLPDDYPAQWGWRGYNEQQALVGLLSSGAWQPLFASHYVRTRLAEHLAGSIIARLPALADCFPASLWLCRAP